MKFKGKFKKQNMTNKEGMETVTQWDGGEVLLMKVKGIWTKHGEILYLAIQLNRIIAKKI